MDEEPWHITRTRELKAAAPAKRNIEPFVKVPLWWIAAAAKSTRNPGMLVCIELLRASWKAKGPTFPLPNRKLGKLGASRDVKRRVTAGTGRSKTRPTCAPCRPRPCR